MRNQSRRSSLLPSLDLSPVRGVGRSTVGVPVAGEGGSPDDDADHDE